MKNAFKKKLYSNTVDKLKREGLAKFAGFSLFSLLLTGKASQAHAADGKPQIASKNLAAQQNGVTSLSGIDDIRKLVPGGPGERVLIAFSHAADGPAAAAVNINLRGGWFSAVQNAERPDDGGIFFRVNQQWGWQREFAGEVDAQWFGVFGDGVDCHQQIDSALNYISHYGGTLKFPAGKINFGTWRVELDSDRIKQPFEITGYGNATTFVFENVDPADKQGELWAREPALFAFIGESIDSYLPQIKLTHFTIDYSAQRNQGGNSLKTLHQTHPSPYSLGVWAIYFYYAFTPLVENVVLRNVYGNGIVMRKSFYPVVRSCQGYNVSANNVVSAGGNMAKDSDGGFCFIWSCFSGLVENCVAWNNRVYNVNFSSPDNAVPMRNTLCGYIGIWAEYSLNQDGGSPPLTHWISDKVKKTDAVSNGIVFRNNIVYGYTIGIKTESNVDASISSNVILNCYLPLLASGTKSAIFANWVDMLQCSELKCPQEGLEFKRSCIGGATWSAESDDMGLLIEKNYVKTSRYPLFLVNRNNMRITANTFVITNGGKLFDSKDNKLVQGVSIDNNVFHINDSPAKTVATVTYNRKIAIKDNKFNNTSSYPCFINLLKNGKGELIEVSGNIFDGLFRLFATSTCSISNNYFNNHGSNAPLPVVVKADFSSINNNQFDVSANLNSSLLYLEGKRVEASDNLVKIAVSVNKGAGKITSFITIGGKNSQDVVVNGNTMSGNSVNAALIKSQHAEMLTAIGNSSDSDAWLFDPQTKVTGPLFIDRNQFKAGIIKSGTDLNAPDNISANYTPCTGQRLYSTNPRAGDAEGVVYTSAGWKKFGVISQ